MQYLFLIFSIDDVYSWVVLKRQINTSNYCLYKRYIVHVSCILLQYTVSAFDKWNNSHDFFGVFSSGFLSLSLTKCSYVHEQYSVFMQRKLIKEQAYRIVQIRIFVATCSCNMDQFESVITEHELLYWLQHILLGKIMLLK